MFLFVVVVVSNKKRHRCLCMKWLRMWGDLCFAPRLKRADEGTPKTTSKSTPTQNIGHAHTHSHHTHRHVWLPSFSCKCSVPFPLNIYKKHNTKQKKKERIDKLNRLSHHKPLQPSLLLARSPHSEHFLDWDRP